MKNNLARSIKAHSLKLGIAAFVVCILGIGGINREKIILVFLPGTQVGTVEAADDVRVCKQCHYSNSVERPVGIFKDWAGSMMAHSARDPIFYAALAVANKYHPTSGEYCIRCHSPTGWLAGHSEDFSGQALQGTDFDGVQCDYCHRSGDPLNPDTSIAMVSNYLVPGYGNGMHAIQRYASPKRGPYDSVLAPHQTRYEQFQSTGKMCGICHDVSNPFYAQDRIHQAPHEYGALERTYSEWLMSWYATQGDSGTCQSCHMKSTTGYACIYTSAPLRTHLAQHDLTGGNTFVPDILQDFWPDVDSASVAAGKQRTIATLQRAADLEITANRSGDSVIARVRITNRTGHKLPTGYPDGRRMWIAIIGRNSFGDTVFQSGTYDADSAVLRHDSQIKVYEAIHGMTDSIARLYSLPAGPSLHFILNDTILFDNRIPPRGFTNSGFQQRLANPVGVTYADSQYWDETTYTLPVSTVQVTATLFYQTISKEYAQFLRDQNVGNSYDWNSWGAGLYNSWDTRGKSEPVTMNSLTVPVNNPMSVDNDRFTNMVPREVILSQNYPNPFNPTTTIPYDVQGVGFVSLKIFDLVGKEVHTLVNSVKQTGHYEVSFDASNLPSGVYLYAIQARNIHQTKKMLLIR
ncbi:MAG: T9SS type A sorting domain-containing protein [Ignavibacteria bacterium]|nr:T9SS type A sorting domain-containing protein [Ignavibacteria bacterium]